MQLTKLAQDCEWPHGLILDKDQVDAQALQAARYFAGYADIATLAAPSSAALTVDVELSAGEWVVISPLFKLYVERENARALEASRNMGLDVYGRQVDAIEADIRQFEADLPRLAFCTPPVSV